MNDFESYCKVGGHRLTDPRKYVLEIILATETPLGAYDVLEKLGDKLDNPKPPTAYRAIEFLLEHGFIHRIESLNAYVACESDHSHEGSQFMICDDCGKVIETHFCHLPDSFQKRLAEENFAATHWNLEIHGRCAACR